MGNGRPEKMDEFDNVLTGAAAALAPEYFLLPVHRSNPVYRERVYCYELYHQMRCRWPEGCAYVLNGEVDKQQHPDFEGPGYPKPDFLVHVPGTRENYEVIEVKPRVVAPDDIRNDIAKLIQFRDWYQRALYLLYGVGPEEARERIAACAVNAGQLCPIELWVHPVPGEPATRVAWDGQEAGGG